MTARAESPPGAPARILLDGEGRVREDYRQTFCVVVAAISCCFTPLGTVLGVFTLIVLFRPSVKALFGLDAPSAAA